MDLMNQIDHLYMLHDAGEIESQTLKDTLDSFSVDTVEQVEKLACAFVRRKGFVDSIKDEIVRLQDRRMQVEAEQEKIKNLIKDYMTKTNNEKIKTALASVSIRKNPEAVHIIDEAKVGKKFFVIRKEISKTLIKDFIKNGGKCRWAELRRSESVVIK